MDELVGLLCDGTMRAAAEILSGRYPGMAAQARTINADSRGLDLVTAAMRQQLKATINDGSLVAQMKELVAIHASRELIRSSLNAMAWEQAINAVQWVGDELAEVRA